MMSSPSTLRFGDATVPVRTAQVVVVGTGAAGYRAAEALHQLGQTDVVVVTDRVRAGTSRNAGSDKQTYYKLTLAGAAADSVRELAETLFAGGAVDGDNALAEAAWSTRAFLHLVDSGVPFPTNQYGEFVGYKTDHDPRQRATSAGPYTSRAMVESLETRVRAQGTVILDHCRVVDLITTADETGSARVVGLLVLRTDQPPGPGTSPWLLLRCAHVVYATGGPAGLYATSVYPHGQWGATGAAFRAGAQGQNLTEWQFGLASLVPRWNVSGSYMQALPRFVSTNAAGGDERDCLAAALPDLGRRLSLVFRKGYQWPFDVGRAQDGSSLIDLLVYRETVLGGRRVWLDFRPQPGDPPFDPSCLDDEARDYLTRTGALGDSPIERLRQLNEPAYRFYRDKQPAVDLAADRLEIAVCAQHNNGGLGVDAWWQSNLRGLYPVGEAAGAHGVYRPGGAALNSGQVGALRAATYIAHHLDVPVDDDTFIAVATPVVATAQRLVDAATDRAASGQPETTDVILRALQALMTATAGPVRTRDGLAAALTQVHAWHSTYADQVVAVSTSRRGLDRLIQVRDLLSTAEVYLAAMADYADHTTGSRGSALSLDPAGAEPAWDPTAASPTDFHFTLDNGALDAVIQVAAWDAQTGQTKVQWRPRRPLPDTADDVFENVWREFRTHGNIT